IHHRRACAAGWGPWAGRHWGHHHGGCSGRRHHHHHHHRHGPPPVGRTWLWSALARLDLSPAQEKVVRAEVDRLRERAGALREEAKSSRGDMAASVRGDSLDEETLAGMFVRQDDLLRELRGDLAGALGRIHAALDPEQRERLADLIERGPGADWGRGGPYR